MNQTQIWNKNNIKFNILNFKKKHKLFITLKV